MGGSKPVDVMPAIEPRDDDVLLGEEVLFRAGLRSVARVDADELYARECQLVVTAPDGSVTVHPRGASSYDGPSKITSWFHHECLNDLEAMTAGTYDLRYLCEGREARCSIHVKARPAPELIVVAELPDPIDVEPGRPFAVRIEVENAGRAPVRMVPPNSCHAAGVVGYVSSAEPPSWSRLDRTSEHEDAHKPGHRTRIAPERDDQLALIELSPGARYGCGVRFDGVFRSGVDARWLPRERFAVTVGLVLHVFVPGMGRPVRWLKRVRATYLVGGAMHSTGDARCERWEWVQITPSGFDS